MLIPFLIGIILPDFYIWLAMSLRSNFVVSAVLAFSAISVYATTAISVKPVQEAPSSRELDVDLTQEDVFQRYSIVPVLGYTEETEFQYGFMALFFLKPDERGGKVPEIGVTAYGSTRDQLNLTLEPYFYLFHDRVTVWSLLKYQDWVAGYYGRGNDPDIDRFVNFDRKKFLYGTRIESRVGLPEMFKYGTEIHVEFSDIEFEEGGEQALPDDHSGWRNGIGYLFGLDTRDNTNWTRHGYLAQWQQMFYMDKFGDYTFNVESLDLRGYTELLFGTSLALGFLWQRAEGDVPFDMLAGPDGICRFRGVESLYFNDNQAVIVQAEARRFLFWRFATHVFFEGGKSGGYFSELLRNEWHKSLGMGALVALNLKESLFARADFSWVDFDHLGLSFYVRQAF